MAGRERATRLSGDDGCNSNSTSDAGNDERRDPLRTLSGEGTPPGKQAGEDALELPNGQGKTEFKQKGADRACI